MKKILDNITIVLFFVLILLLGCSALIKYGIPSDIKFSDKPDEAVGKMISEGFPVRRSWNELYSRTSRIMGQEEIFGIYYERSGDRLIKLFGEKNTSFIENSINAVNTFHQDRPGMPVYMMLIPSASGIYRGRLPLPSEAADQQKLIDEIYYRIDSDVIPLDVWGALYSARDDYIYFRTSDRWTSLGAYNAYAASISKLGFAPYTLSNYDVDYTNTEYHGELAETSGIFDTAPDTINVYRCKFGSYVKSCTVLRTNGIIDTRSSVYSKNGLRSDDKYAYFLGTAHYKTANVKTASEDAPRLLMIGSDYASCFLPFLAPHFSEIALINPFELNADETIYDYIDPEQFDQALILCDIGSFCDKRGFERINITNNGGHYMKNVLNDNSIKKVGRTYTSEDGTLWSALSGTGAEFSFNGKKLEVTFAGDETATPTNLDNAARVAVFADGRRVADTLIDSAEKIVTVFDSEEPVYANIRIIKLSECAMSCCGIKAISTDNEAIVTPAVPSEKRIEFIGDSITCGYGIDDEDPLHHFHTSTEDVTRAYAYKTAQLLGADYSMFSISGYGIISGYTEGDRRPDQTIPQYYESMGFSYGSFGGKKSQSLGWDFSSFTPDIVVINLGTNDDSYCKDDESRRALYTEEYVNFLKNVRGHYPNAYILCTVGIMGQRIFKPLESAVQKYKSESGDVNISTMLFDEQLPADGLVADYHPTEITHSKAAERLAAEIGKIMNW